MRKTKKQRVRASILAFLLIASMVFGMVPNSVGQVYAKESTSSSSEEETGFIDKAINFFQDTGDKIASFFGAGDEPSPAAALDETSIVDKETSQDWRGIVENTTQNIGRIWTDKSVYNSSVELPGIGGGAGIPITKPEESDFMVGLSALSSTSNTSVTAQTPLDIVLVLDVSGSMRDEIGTINAYQEAYRIDTTGITTYYALNENGKYEEIKRVTRPAGSLIPIPVFDHWELNGVTVEPKTRQNDNNPDHIQFYTYGSVSVSKMDALKTAVNEFIDATANQNASITDSDKQHHISIVKYANNQYYRGDQDSVGDNVNRGDNYSQIVSKLTGDMNSLKTAVNGLEEGGPTAADFGMSLANRVLNSSAGHGVRQNTQKVVVMFTDGEPNHGNNFDGDVANSAIRSAKSLKDAGTLVYSIGVLEGADPNNTTTNINRYLHGISSNYPNATAYTQLGDRTPESKFYKAATNSDELNNIFQEISQEINSGTGYPTDTEEGFENRDGYVTFHDQLGDYMQVDSFNRLVLNDERFDAEKTEAEGKIKYTYSGEVDLNGDGKSESVSDIVITVTPGTGSIGDTVDVSIPATLLPLRNFKVDITGNTMSVEDKYPLRLFYNVSLKEDAKKALANPDQEMKNYIAQNTDAGKVYFYSNKFTGSKQGPTEGTTLGDTTATFEPASGNSFYYFTENTPLWLDKDMKEPVTAYNANREVYYYGKTYYKLENGAPKEVTEVVPFRSHPQDEVRDWVGTATDGQLYIKAGAPRLTRIHDLTAGKKNPVPGTATEVITPNWDNELNQRLIEVSLGNNGRLAVELPGTLEIKKTVTSEVEAPKDKEFTFTLTLKNAEGQDLTGEFDAQKFDAQGVASGASVKVQNKGTVTLKDGESVKIYGLSNGDTYSIEENQIPKGFKATKNPITGTIVGNETVTAAFENTYVVTPAVLEGESSIRAQKVLNGRDWAEGDSFKFVLRPVEGEAPPLPEKGEGTTVVGNDMIKVVTNGDVFSFGKMTFTKPGTYKYVVFEENPGAENALPGVSYSRARYRVDIVVTDNGEGQLSATSTMLKRADDLGQEISGDVSVANKIAVLTNTFEAESVQWGVRGNKVYIDNSGTNPLKKDMFHFQIKPVVDDVYTEEGPLPEGKGSNALSGQINFGSVECGSKHYNKKYLYKITEIVPAGVTSENPTKDGMTYDTRAYYLEVSFALDPKTNTMTATSKYFNEKMEPIPDMTEFVFENEYRPEPVTIGESTDTAVKGSKTLNGRAMKADEFSFELTARNDAAIKGLADNSIVFAGDDKLDSMSVIAPTVGDGDKSEFKFGDVKFTKPGTYEFNMKEVIPDSKAGGMTYDEHTEVVTVLVTDKKDADGHSVGVLEAQIIYDNDGAAFVNTYQASHNYVDDGGALVTKTLKGRDMKVNEFQFTITGTGENADEANKKLAEADKKFINYAQKDGVASEMPKLQNLQFTEADAGKTFTYLIDEVMPEEANKAGGVTYDQSEFTLAIEVIDNKNGTMSTKTTVIRVKASDGKELEVKDVLGEYEDAEKVVAVPFVNNYKAESVSVDTTADASLRKVLRGRDWTEKDSFTFTMTPQDGAPIPKVDEAAGITVDESGNVHGVVTAPKDGAKAGERVYFGFGSITYDEAGTYVYTVTEDVPDPKAGGMTYSENIVTITVNVTDPGTGKLEAAVNVSGTINNRTFYNDYAASLNHNAAGGIVTQKILTGHALEKDQFTFQVKALEGTNTTADENAKRIGLTNGTFAEYTNIADTDNDGTVVMKTQNDHAIVFTNADIGKTFVYQFSEKGKDGEFGIGGEEAGYTYDNAVYTVELWVTDDLDGTLTLHTRVSKNGSVISEKTSDETKPIETILAFNNSYAASGKLEGTANLAGTKKMDGPWEATGKDLSGFQFNIAGGNDATNAAIEAGTVELPQNKTVTSDAQGNFNFDSITFNKKGIYKFTVSEVVPAEEDKIPGVSYNAQPVTITVEVTDNDNGSLTAVPVGGSPKLEFTNNYEPTQDATFTPSVVKRVEGLDAKENFTFKLSAADEATKSAINDKMITGIGTVADPYSSEKTTTGVIMKGNQQTVNFNELTFTKAGTYKFTVEEINANAPTGWTYDGHTYELTIEVRDINSVLKAGMVLTDPNTNSSIFTNSFAATTSYGEEGGLNVTKTLNGRTLAENMFDFTITGVETDSVTAEDANAKLAEADKKFQNAEPNADGVAVMSKLGNVKFDQTDIGKTYKYIVSETAGADTKYIYDRVPATVEIQVLEKGGKLYTVTTVTKGNDVKEYDSADSKVTAVVAFVNSYTPDIVTIEPGAFAGNVTKVLKGNRGTALAAGEFDFQMMITPKDGTSGMDGVVLPEGAKDNTLTAANQVDGSVSFGDIQFKKAGTYHVEISEVIPAEADPNMTYDKHTFSYDIAVTYNAAEGTLSAAVVEGSQSGSKTFINIYEAKDAKDVVDPEDPTTSVNGKVVGVGDELTYTIDWVNNAVDKAGAPANAKVTIIDKVPEGTTFVSADNEGAYNEETNTITWNLGEQEAGASGTVSFVVKVLGSASETGVTNKAEIKVGDNDPKQTNEVTTNVPDKDSVVESGGELQVGKVLTYTISYMNPEAEAATVTIQDIIPEGLDYVEDSASHGAVYNEDDQGNRTLTWTLEDVQPGASGTVTFDAKVNESAETVVENKATIQIGENGPTYDTDTDSKDLPEDGNLAISKTIALTEGQGTEIDKTKSFTFKVELKDAKGEGLTKEYEYTVTDGSGKEIKGMVTNGTEISLLHGQTATIKGLPDGARYTVTEKDASGYKTSVNGKEGKSTSGEIAKGETKEANFTNTYSVSGSLDGSKALIVTKKLVGREWLDTDTFAYELTAADDKTKSAVEDGFIKLPDNAGNLEIKKDPAEHKAAFGEIQFTIAGTFTFKVTEQPSGISGITDDKNAERTVVVKVTDKKDGKLEAVVVEDKSENLDFTNTYGAGTKDEDIAAQIPATKKLTGRNMKAGEFQFEVVTRKADEKVEGFKEEVVATGENAKANANEAGTVTFAGKDGVKLTYTVESLNKAVEAGYAVKEVKEGQSVWTVSYTARELTDNLPGGVTAVEGKTSYDFTIVVADNNKGTLTAEVKVPEGGIAFENAYSTGGAKVDTDTAADFNKKLVGRDWLDTDEFTFTITPTDGAPAPEKTTTTVKKADAKEGELVPFGFGKITFADADMAGAKDNGEGGLVKTFTYEITEGNIDASKMPGVTKDSHVATLMITVTDNQQGELSASASMTTENGTFTNTYESSLDYTGLSGLQITKVLKGRDMEAGQFTFTVTPEGKDSAEKLGLAEGANEFKNTAKPAGEVDTIDVLAGKSVTFTQEDAGKTFTYTVEEKVGDNKAYTYDEAPRTVTIEVKDNKNATLTVTTTVKKDNKVVSTQSVTTGGEGQKKATVAFENTYNADPTTLGGEGNVKINAKKSLTNRPMVADEFKFNVLDNKETVVTTGKNGSDGNITFKPIQYTTDKLIKDAKAGIATKTIKDAAYVYTYEYKVVEAESNFDDGVTPISPAFAIKVVVTDEGNGKLSINVVYPDGTNNVLPFENAYGAEANGVIEVNGEKTLEVESGTNAPDITDKYTFTIEGSEGAPMPEKTKATNDAAGNVDFGTIQYTMENVFGSEPAPLAVDNTETDETEAEPTVESDEVMPVKSEERTKEFTYTVKESGNVAGVDNDNDSEKTFKVTVTDNGDGTITVDGPKEFAFEFTNTYRVDPVDYSISTDLTINKELDGRELREGEFTFELVNQDGKVVSTAQNGADGSVTFGKLTYKNPGTYNYVIREKNDGAGGVEYDSAEHTVVVVVTDNGDGTMTAKTELKSRDGENVKDAIVFKNIYKAQSASVTLGASKAYSGGELKDGQFTFELRDRNDRVVSRVKNNATGQVTFETIEFKKVGTYKYKISEVNDKQENVTYDENVYGVTVTVTDNGEGSLMAEVEYDGGIAPVFTNKYTKPEKPTKPAKPEEPKGPTAVKTGDETPVIPFIILMVATLTIIVTITFIFFRRKRR